MPTPRIGRGSIERFREFSGEDEFAFRETPYVWFVYAGDDRRGDTIREKVAGMKHHGIEAELINPETLAALTPTLDTDDVGVAALAHNAGWTEPATYVEAMAEKARESDVEIRTHKPVSLA